MTRLASTGHRGLPTTTAELADSALRAEVGGYTDLVELSCLADGADTPFARAVLDHGSSLVAFVPAAEYREGLPANHHAEYDALLGRADDIIRLDHVESTSESPMAAGLTMLDSADVLVAVWDGKPARGFGGTADVVEAARLRSIPVTVIWPAAAERD